MAPQLPPQGFTLRSRSVYILLASLSLALILLLQRPPVLAQSGISQATVAEILDGNQVFIQNKQARVNDVASKGKQVRTGQSRAQLVFNNGAVARLSPNSSLTIGQSCARLQRGTLLINGAANGCTSSISSGVRGTTYVLEVNEDGAEQVLVLEGEVTVSQRDPREVQQEDSLNSLDSDSSGPLSKQLSLPTPPPVPGAPPFPGPRPPAPASLPAPRQAAPQVLTSGQKVGIANGQPGPIETLSQTEFEQLLAGSLFNGFNLQLPGIAKVRDSFQMLFPGVPFPLELPGLPIPGIPGVPINVPGIPGL